VAEEPTVMAPRALSPPPEAAPAEEARGDGDKHVRVNKRAKLRMTIARYAANHPAALNAVLEKAPESAKPALRRAIDIAEARYEKALEALD